MDNHSFLTFINNLEKLRYAEVRDFCLAGMQKRVH